MIGTVFSQNEQHYYWNIELKLCAVLVLNLKRLAVYLAGFVRFNELIQPDDSQQNARIKTVGIFVVICALFPV